jgi:non-ribosomal peptide synthetase component F
LSQVTGSSRHSTRRTPTTASPLTIPDSFRAVVAQHPDRLAYQDRNRSVTYAEFDRESNAVANSLLRILDDRPLALVAPVSIDSFTLVFGALKAGRLVAPLDPRWPVEQWLEVAGRLDGRLVVPDAESREELGHSAAANALVAADLRGDDTAPPVVDIDADEPAMVFFTSGSTGGMAQHDVFLALHSRIVRAHHAPPFAGTTVLMGSTAYLDVVAPIADRLLPSVDDGGRRRDVALAVGHDDLLREPAVSVVARLLEPLLSGQTWQAAQ